MRRWLLAVFGLLAILAGVDWVVSGVRGSRPVLAVREWIAEARPPIVVGLIHSRTGALAISETSLIDAEVLALEEINARGGIAGRLVRWEIADGRSDAPTFASQAARLIEQDKAEVLIGGWTAECRKALLAVVEEKKGLLIFPSNFEGVEHSRRVVYSGGSANQVFPPAVRWCFETLKARKFFVVGTEELWSRMVAELCKDAVKASAGATVGESYLPMIGGDVEELVQAIRAAKPDVVLNVMVGDSNVPFYGAYRRAGLTPETLPIVGFNVAEDELKRFPPGDATGHYAAWSYFQSLDRPENVEFVRKFRARHGQDRVLSDAMEAAYNGVHIWAQAAHEAGTTRPDLLMVQFDRQSFDAPEGIVTIDPQSLTAWRPFFLGKARADGQFDIVSSLAKPNHPELYPATRSRAQWEALLGDLKARWGGRWSAPDVPRPNPAKAPG